MSLIDLTTFYLKERESKQVCQCIDLLSQVFKEDLLGVYLYGSSILGGLQKYSDLDLFVLASRALTLEEKRLLVKVLLKISGVYMKGTKRPIEMTVVELSGIKPWKYPPVCDFQYGEW